MRMEHAAGLPEGDMTIAQPLKVGFEAQKIRPVPNGTADFNYKAFLFELTWDILHSVVRWDSTRSSPIMRRA